MIIDIKKIEVPLSFWQSKVLLIVGPPCSGKHTLAKDMCAQIGSLKILNTITTRSKRLQVQNDEVIFVTKKDFERRFLSGNFFYANRKEKIFYAYSKSEILQESLKGFGVILIFHSNGALALKKNVHGIPTIFLEAPIDLLIERCRKRGDWKENRHKELLTSISINQKTYAQFKTKEQNCIQISNGSNTSSIPRNVVESAITFYRRISSLD